MMRATTRWRDNVVEFLEVLDEEGFRRRCVILAAAVRHRLSTAGLIERIRYVGAKPFEHLQRGNADLGKKAVDVTRDEQSHSHDAPSLPAVPAGAGAANGPTSTFFKSTLRARERARPPRGGPASGSSSAS